MSSLSPPNLGEEYGRLVTSPKSDAVNREMKNPSSGKAFTEVSVCGHFCQVLGNNCESAGSSYPVSFSHEMLRAVIALMITLRPTCPEALLRSRLQSTQLQNRANSLFHGATEGYARTKFPAPKNQMMSPPFIVGQREVLCHPSFAYQVIPSLRTQLKHSSPKQLPPVFPSYP